MTSGTQTLWRGSRAGVFSSVPGNLLHRWWKAYWAARAQRASVRLLSSLNDRTLQDIGVDRSEIESIVYAKSRERVRRYQPSCE
jgi:uncharacterized protein YjiS (DUF1127 family)